MSSEQGLLDLCLAGRSVVGIHVSFEEGQRIKSDPRYQSLSEEKKRILGNLIDPPKHPVE